MVKRGVCGTCGTAVVAPDNPTEGWNEPFNPDLAWAEIADSQNHRFNCTADFRNPSYGHLFQAGKLIRVRCLRCAYVEKNGLGS